MRDIWLHNNHDVLVLSCTGMLLGVLHKVALLRVPSATTRKLTAEGLLPGVRKPVSLDVVRVVAGVATFLPVAGKLFHYIRGSILSRPILRFRVIPKPRNLLTLSISAQLLLNHNSVSSQHMFVQVTDLRVAGGTFSPFASVWLLSGVAETMTLHVE